ncbi:MAG TPA: hypothetical protein VJO33_00545 [Gemmatimonadaceae bacterium]|nr:hypothetical protein [Gemmatimonadaceae bacterium]
METREYGGPPERKATLFVVTFIVDLSWYFSDLAACFRPSWQIFRGDLCGGHW